MINEQFEFLNYNHKQKISPKMSNDRPLIKFKNKDKCLEIIKRYNIFNQKVTDDSNINVSNYLKFILEHAEKKIIII